MPLNYMLSSLMEGPTGKGIISEDKQMCVSCTQIEDPCPAKIWCIQCREALCDQCNTFIHKRVKNFDSHQIVPVGEMSTIQIAIPDPDEPCMLHKEEVLKLYCLDHRALCCVLCLALHHRTCDRIKTIAEVAKGVTHNLQIVQMNKKLDEILHQTGILQKAKDDNISCLREKHLSLKEKVSSTIDGIRVKLDKWQDEFNMASEHLHKQKSTELGEKRDIIEHFQKTVKNGQSMLQIISKHGSDKQIFILTEKLRSQISGHMEELQQAMEDDSHIDMCLELDKVLETMSEKTSVAKATAVETKSNQVNMALSKSVEGFCGLVLGIPSRDDLKVSKEQQPDDVTKSKDHKEQQPGDVAKNKDHKTHFKGIQEQQPDYVTKSKVHKVQQAGRFTKSKDQNVWFNVFQSQDDIVFETFYHRSGREFLCMYKGGIRHYLDDWGSKEWLEFPKRWYNEGLLITNNVVKDDQAVAEDTPRRVASNSRSQGRQVLDDREGVINHPNKGKINTYIFQRKHNIHSFMDPHTGQWMRMPIGYELHHELVGRLVDQVEESLPNWKDRHDILSLLRQCNYDADECIATYLNLEGDVWMTAPKTSKDAKVIQAKDDKIAELQNLLKHLNEEYKKEKQARQDAEKLNEEYKKEKQARQDAEKLSRYE